MRFISILLSFFILGSVFAGYLYITQERYGTGTRFILNWAQGESSYNTGPAQCWAGRPKGDATYINPGSDDSGPYTPDVVQNCQECDCNLGSSIKDYECLSGSSCKRCDPCPTGCGTYETCDTSQGLCNSECVCDPVKCTGSYCVGDTVYTRSCSGKNCVGSPSETCKSGCYGKTYYSGCSGGSCDSGTTYPCDGCQQETESCTCDIYDPPADPSEMGSCHQETHTYCPGGTCPCTSNCPV